MLVLASEARYHLMHLFLHDPEKVEDCMRALRAGTPLPLDWDICDEAHGYAKHAPGMAPEFVHARNAALEWVRDHLLPYIPAESDHSFQAILSTESMRLVDAARHTRLSPEKLAEKFVVDANKLQSTLRLYLDSAQHANVGAQPGPALAAGLTRYLRDYIPDAAISLALFHEPGKARLFANAALQAGMQMFLREALGSRVKLSTLARHTRLEPALVECATDAYAASRVNFPPREACQTAIRHLQDAGSSVVESGFHASKKKLTHLMELCEIALEGGSLNKAMTKRTECRNKEWESLGAQMFLGLSLTTLLGFSGYSNRENFHRLWRQMQHEKEPAFAPYPTHFLKPDSSSVDTLPMPRKHIATGYVSR